MVKSAGFTIIELLVSLVLIGTLTVQVMGFLLSHKKLSVQEELGMTMEENLRVGMNIIEYNLRQTGYGVPETNLSTWIPWVTGFTSNPKIVQGSGTDPDSLSVASCSAQPVATFTTSSGTNPSVQVSSTSVFNASYNRLILIDFSEYAHVHSVSNAANMTIDTDLGTSGQQGPSRDYPAGTPICRIDVSTFDVDTTNNRLRLDKHDGNGAQALVDGIQDFQIQTISAGEQYKITLTARSESKDPFTKAYLTRTLSSTVTLRN